MTTRSTPSEPWDDERLGAAFAARASRTRTPEDLASTVGAALRTRPGSVVEWRRLLAPAAVVILAFGAVGGGLALRGSSGVVETTDGPTPEPSAAAADSWADREAVGLPIISVSDAIAIRDAGVDSREIAVHGWIAPVLPVPCPYTPATSPVQPVCPDDQVVLMEEPESLVTPNGNGSSRRSPTGPHFQIDLDDLDGAWQRGVPVAPSTPPVEIAVVGHFDDRRSASCPLDMQAACRDRFVVDRVDWANGEAQPTSQVDLVVGVGMPFDDVEHILDAVRPGVSILSAVHVDGDEGLRRMEPALAEGGSSLIQEAQLWVVRVLDAGELGTYVIVDSTGSIYELTAEGPVLAALTTPGEPVSPSPSPSPTSPAWGPWPPQNAFSVMEFKDDAGRKAFVAIVDASGLLESVAEGVPDPAIGGGAFEGFVRDPSGAHRYRLRWTTTICDREMTVSIAREVARIVIESAPRDGCDALAIGRDLVLQFTEDVDPAAVELQIIEPTLLPESPPEPTTMVVELQRGDSTESVLVVDNAASLMEARAANPVPNVPDFLGVQIVRADDGGTIVLWDGALCDRDLWISIEADDLGPPDRIVVHGTRVEPCRQALVRRAIWLDLGPVDVTSIRGQPLVVPSTDAQRDPGPVIDVAGALVIRSHPGDDHQLQVRGWYWRDPAIYDCLVPPSPPPALESGCNGPRDRLVADPEDLTGPGFAVWLRPGAETSPIPHGDPSEFVVIGHFDDTLAEACAASTRDSCRNVFVVDEVLPAATP